MSQDQQEYVSLSFLKISSGFLLALSAFLGSLLPEILLRNSKPGEFTATILPIGNALSAGLLFGAGMLHFFSEGTSQLATIASEHDHLQHEHMHASDIRGATSSGFTTAAPAMMAGFLVSLILDRVVLESLKRNRKLPDWVTQHSHSHGTPDDHHFHHHQHQNHGEQHHDEKCDLHEEQEGMTTNSTSSAIQEKEDLTVDESSFPPSSVHSFSSHRPKNSVSTGTASATSASTVLTIAVLMSLHSAIEGTTLALETSAKTLRGAFIPLFIHRFFDGLVVGLQATGMSTSATTTTTTSSENNNNNNTSSNNNKSSIADTCTRMIFRKATLVLLCWSVITPVVLIVVLVFADASGSSQQQHGSNDSKTSSSSVPTMSNSKKSLLQQNDDALLQHHGHSHGSGPTSFAGAWAQCFAAGSFVYISAELLNDVFSKSAGAGAVMSNAKDWISLTIGNMNARVLGLIGGVGIVLLLESYD